MNSKMQVHVAESSAHELEVMCGGFQKDVKGEDRFTIHDAIIAGDHCYFVVVADGHGGQDAVIHAAKRILPLIAEAAANGSSVELNRACVQSFRALHDEILASGTTSGSTLTVCCINASKHELHVWNVGDSLAVLVDATSHAPLGVSHRLESNPEEQARVGGVSRWRVLRAMCSCVAVEGGVLIAAYVTSSIVSIAGAVSGAKMRDVTIEGCFHTPLTSLLKNCSA